MYFTLIAAIFRAGHVAFPISPRNSPKAVAHLLSATKVDFVLVGAEDALQQLVASAQIELRASKARLPRLSPFPNFAEFYDSSANASTEMMPPRNFNWEDPVVIIHSSGA